MDGQARVESVFAWICTDKEDNTEGVPAGQISGYFMPLYSTRLDLALKMKPVAEKLVSDGHKMALVEFSSRITHDVLSPEMDHG